MKNVYKLAVQLVATTGPFEKGLKQSRGHINSFSVAARKASFSVAKLFGGLTAGLSLVAFTRGIKNAFKDIDAMAKASARLGISTENFRRLEYVAKLSGASIESVSKSLQQLQRRLSAATSDAKGIEAEAFAGIGVNVRSLMGMDPLAQFRAAAEAIRGLTNQNDKVRMIMDIFGKGGMELANVLAMSSAEFDKLIKQADATGRVISRWDASRIEAANDAMTRLGEHWSGIKEQIAIATAPYLARFVSGIGDGVDAAGRMQSAFAWIGHTVDAIAGAIQNMGLSWAWLKKVRAEWSAMFWGTASLIAESGQTREKQDLLPWDEKSFLQRRIWGASKNMREAREGFDAKSAEWEKSSASQHIANLEAIERKRRKAEAGGAKADTGQLIADMEVRAEALDKLRQSAARIKEGVRTPWEIYRDEVADLNEMLKAGPDVLDMESYRRAIDKAATARDDAIEKLSGGKDKLDKLEDPMAAWFEKAAGIYESTRTPIEKYMKDIQDLRTMLSLGAMDYDTYTRAMIDAREQLDAGLDRKAFEPFDVGEAAQVESFKHIAFGGVGRLGQRPVQYEQAERTNVLLQQLLNSIEGGVPAVVY